MAQVRIDFQGRGKVETFSRVRVQAMGNDIQLALRVARQVRARGQVLTQQPIGIFIGAALPRLYGSAKNTRIASRSAKRSCSAISFPRSEVSVLRRTGTIGSAPRDVAGQLTAYGAGDPPQHRRHRPQRMAVGQPQAQGLTVFGTHVSVASRWPGNTVTLQGLKCCIWN